MDDGEGKSCDALDAAVFAARTLISAGGVVLGNGRDRGSMYGWCRTQPRTKLARPESRVHLGTLAYMPMQVRLQYLQWIWILRVAHQCHHLALISQLPHAQAAQLAMSQRFSKVLLRSTIESLRVPTCLASSSLIPHSGYGQRQGTAQHSPLHVDYCYVNHSSCTMRHRACRILNADRILTLYSTTAAALTALLANPSAQISP